jgi:hypothetical protein
MLRAEGEVDWAHRRGARVRVAAARGHRRPPRRPGLAARHVQPAPRRARRLRDRRASGCRSPPRRRPGQVLDLRLAAVGVRRARLRVRLLARQPRRARDVGGAVRRLRQRRPDHHRPVPRRRRGQVGPDQRPRAAAAARLRGAGPRALLGRIERFLMLCAEDNIQVATPPPRRSTSTCCAARCTASVRKPLVVFTPKQGCGHEADALARSTSSRPARSRRCSTIRPRRRSRRRRAPVVFCSGKVAWDAMAERDERGAPVAVVRVEQLYPWPSSRCSSCSPATRTPRARLAPGGAGEHGAWNATTSPRRPRRVGQPRHRLEDVHDQELAELMDETRRGPYGSSAVGGEVAVVSPQVSGGSGTDTIPRIRVGPGYAADESCGADRLPIPDLAPTCPCLTGRTRWEGGDGGGCPGSPRARIEARSPRRMGNTTR